MKIKIGLFALVFAFLISSCSEKADYSPEYMEQTTGRYLYNSDEIIDVYYENNNLYLKWKGAEKVKPVALDDNIFFVADMYKKLHFVQHPETKERYLSILNEEDASKISYDFLKVSQTYKTPRMHLKSKAYNEALSGFIEMQKRDSTQVSFSESELNNLGYRHLRKKEYEYAIEVFKMNVTLFPMSNNVYDSLAEAYLLSGDSLQAYTNYKQAYDYNTGNKRAKDYIDAYND